MGEHPMRAMLAARSESKNVEKECYRSHMDVLPGLEYRLPANCVPRDDMVCKNCKNPRGYILKENAECEATIDVTTDLSETADAEISVTDDFCGKVIIIFCR